jgi:hypothetical protein
MFRGRQPGVYSSWRICQVNGFSNNSYRGYQTRDEAEEEFNLFLANEDMAYQYIVVQALPAQGMALQFMYVQGMLVQAMPLQAMAVEAMPQQCGHMFRDFMIVVMLVVITKLVFF